MKGSIPGVPVVPGEHACDCRHGRLVSDPQDLSLSWAVADQGLAPAISH